MNASIKIKTTDGLTIETKTGDNHFDSFKKELYNLLENKTVSEAYNGVEEVVINLTFGK